MPRPEPLSELPRYPLTALVCAAAAGVTLVSMRDPRLIESLYMSEQAFTTEPWRLVGSALPHVGVVHLAFNLYWTWTLGAMLERSFGWLWYLGFIALAGAFSSGAEWMLDSGGVGLSGVGYAMAGVLWALRRTPKYAGMMDSSTAKLFAVWFVLCIVTTAIGVMNVGNVAHGAGALIGFMVGAAVRSQGTRRAGWATAVLAVCALTYVGATTFRTQVNFANFGLGGAGAHIDLATTAMNENRHEDAVKHMRAALAKEPTNAQWWCVLASELYQVGDDAGAQEALQRAVAIAPNDPEVQASHRQVMQGMETRRLIESATAAIREDRHEDAIRDLEKAVKIDDQVASWWSSLGMQYYYAGRIEAAQEALQRYVVLDGSDREIVDFLQQLRTVAPGQP